jgi:3-oxoacyl-[acyl-carrier protein] reductase
MVNGEWRQRYTRFSLAAGYYCSVIGGEACAPDESLFTIHDSPFTINVLSRGADLSELEGKVALVTGGARNIGRSISVTLAGAGAAVAVNTLNSRDEGERVVREIREADGDAELYMADVSDREAVQSMVDGAIQRFGRIDILVLNASVRREVAFKDMTFEQWRQIMSLTLDGSFHCIKACLPSMIAAGGGNIITLAGDTALLGAVRKAHSSTAKNGLVGLTRVLAKELATDGVRVNCVSPGLINTIRPAHRSVRQDAKGLIPLGRWGESDEIAAAVRFLCGPGGGFITGQTLHVNGGQMMFA